MSFIGDDGGSGTFGYIGFPIQDILGMFFGFSALTTPNLLSSFKANLNKNHSSRWFSNRRNHQIRLSLNIGPYQVSSANHVVSNRVVSNRVVSNRVVSNHVVPEHYDIDL